MVLIGLQRKYWRVFKNVLKIDRGLKTNTTYFWRVGERGLFN